jgi:nickel/cobalt exporter
VLTAILVGFALGLRHAADPDHLAAVATLVARQRRPWAAAGIGAAWGLGHALTILLVGGALVATRSALAPSWTARAELAVAAVLVALGVSNLLALRRPVPAPPAPGTPHRILARSAGIGLLHGLAGSAAVALLAVAAMPDAASGLAFLAVFGLGTIGGMVSLSLGVGWPLALAGGSRLGARWLLGGSGVVSIGVGLYLVIESGLAGVAL